MVGRKPWLLFWIYLFTGKKAIFIRVTQQLNETLSWLEFFVLRYFSQALLTNDQQINRTLRQKNFISYYIGNILADCVHLVEFFFVHGNKPIYSFFPRSDHFELDVEVILALLPQLAEVIKGYFLLVIPTGEFSINSLDSVASRFGWHLLKSLEGEILEGYLWKKPYYLNLTIFQGETMVQSEYIISLDPIRTIQAVGLDKKVIHVNQENPQELFSLLNNDPFFFEYFRSLQSRFGKSGAKEKIASYLLWGVVEDEEFIRKKE